MFNKELFFAMVMDVDYLAILLDEEELDYIRRSIQQLNKGSINIKDKLVFCEFDYTYKGSYVNVKYNHGDQHPCPVIYIAKNPLGYKKSTAGKNNFFSGIHTAIKTFESNDILPPDLVSERVHENGTILYAQITREDKDSTKIGICLYDRDMILKRPVMDVMFNNDPKNVLQPFTKKRTAVTLSHFSKADTQYLKQLLKELGLDADNIIKPHEPLKVSKEKVVEIVNNMADKQHRSKLLRVVDTPTNEEIMANVLKTMDMTEDELSNHMRESIDKHYNKYLNSSKPKLTVVVNNDKVPDSE